MVGGRRKEGEGRRGMGGPENKTGNHRMQNEDMMKNIDETRAKKNGR